MARKKVKLCNVCKSPIRFRESNAKYCLACVDEVRHKQQQKVWKRIYKKSKEVKKPCHKTILIM